MKISTRIIFVLFGALFLFVSFGGLRESFAQTSPAPPVVFAAASLKTALDAIAAAWTRASGKQTSISYASSGILAKQIEQGAPADLFVSADLLWMDYLDKANLIKPGSRRTLLGNALVLIAPVVSKHLVKISQNFDLAGATGSGHIAVCTVTSCPAGIYAKQSLVKLGVWPQVEGKLAQVDNVRSALILVARGEADFGIVYATDAQSEPRVKILDTFPDASHDPIDYPIALTARSANPDAANLLAFIEGPVAAKIFAEQGFRLK